MVIQNSENSNEYVSSKLTLVIKVKMLTNSLHEIGVDRTDPYKQDTNRACNKSPIAIFCQADTLVNHLDSFLSRISN